MLKILRFLKPYKGQVAGMFILLILQVAGTLYIPTLTADIINNGILNRDLDYVWSTGGLMIGVALATGLVSVLGTYASSNLAALLGRDSRNALFKKTQALSLNDFNKYGTASIITRTTSDVVLIQQTFSSVVEMIIPAPFMIIVGMTMIFSKSISLGWVVIVAMTLISLLMVWVGIKALPQYEKLQTMLDGMNKKLREVISGVRVIRAFNRTDTEQDKLNGIFNNYADTGIRVNKLIAYAFPAIYITINGLIMLIVWLGGDQVGASLMGVGDITAIIEYTGLILMYLVMAIIAFMSIPRAEISAKRLFEILENPADQASADQQVNPVQPAAKLEFRNVTFRYKGAEEAVLENISFTVDTGQTLAIIGGTGSGKSTISQLISAFYEIESGSILLDGVDIRTMTKEELRQRISTVPQKSFLFSGTIADNLRHGKADATLADMERAASIAQASDFIQNLPDQFESYVAQAGNNFSGGQKQRLSIARALIKPADVYVFDDSFSALDYQTDAKLRARLKKEMTDKAIVLVAQRISTIMDADQILVIDRGKVAGLGRHQELLETNTVYQEIAASQLSQEELHGKTST